MRRVLIVGQAKAASGLSRGPWEAPAGETCRLYRWFGVQSYRELKGMAYLMNVAKYAGENAKGDRYQVKQNLLQRVRRIQRGVDLIFLVGKVAQRAILNVRDERILWRFGQWRGIPHPSGCNLALNHGGDRRTQRFIRRALGGPREDAG